MTEIIKTVTVRNRTIGIESPNICIPLVSRTEDELINECENILNLQPDIVEWRVDHFNGVKDIQRVIDTLHIIKDILPDYPLIFTCRIAEEGGFRKIDQILRMDLAMEVIRSGLIDMMDIELSNGEEMLSDIIAEAHKNNVYIIVSYHDFSATPPKKAIIDMLFDAQESGADIAKIAVMPVVLKDVLTLLEATLEFREKHARIPLITVSMSEKGTISRIVGHLFGSTVTFTSGKAASAPGQIPINELRASMNLLAR